MAGNNEKKTAEKWSFADYAFTITGIVVGVFLVGPELLEALLGITLWGGSLSNVDLDIINQTNTELLTITQLRALSPLLFLITVTVTFAKDTIDARKTGGYKDSMFNHTFETLLEETIYMGVMTIMVFSSVLADAMYISWLAGPITWVLFIFLFPLLRRKEKDAQVSVPWFMLSIFILGIVLEVVIGGWFFFPLSWLILCLFKLKNVITLKNKTLDHIFNIIYYILSVILMALGVGLNFWFTSWTAFPVSLVICWLLSKTKKHNPSG